MLSALIPFLFSCTWKENRAVQNDDLLNGKNLKFEKVSEFIISSPDLTLNNVRQIAIVNFDNSKVAWINEDSNEIFITDLNGEFISKFGSRGSGPEEFGRISSYGFTEDDNIIVYDSSQDYLKLFNLNGDLLQVHQGLLKDGLFIRGYRIFTDGNHYYFGIQESGVSPSVHWQSSIIAKYDKEGNLVKTFGEYDPELVNTDALYKYVNINFDNHSNRFFTTHRTYPKIQSIPLNQERSNSSLGFVSEHFKVSDDPARLADPMHIRREKNVKQSFVGDSFLTDDYYLFHFFNWPAEYYLKRDPNLRSHFFNVYEREYPHAYLGELKLDHPPLFTISNGRIYKLVNEDPENFTIAVYEIEE